MTVDAVPPFERTALLVDLDGTLLDLAPTPDAVTVPPGLPDTLRALRERLAGALAIVTGRPIATVDALLGDTPTAVAGEHGAAIRRAWTAPVERPDLPTVPLAWLATAERLAELHPGALLEHKSHGFALHYRAVPEARWLFHAALTAMLADQHVFQLLPAHMLWEVRPRATDKGVAVTSLMSQPPFAGRLPLFIGDDVTDEDGIAAARAMGGAGLRVDAAFGTPADVRAWLRLAAVTGAWPPLAGATP
jgi:trehalose 6-phosphate phosphatase